MGAVSRIFCPRCAEVVDPGRPPAPCPRCAGVLEAEAVSRIDATERRIIGLCQSPDFSVERLKALYKEIRPGAGAAPC